MSLRTVRLDFRISDSPASMKALIRRLGDVWEATGEVRLDLADCHDLGADGAVASRVPGRSLVVSSSDVVFPGTLACVSFRIDNRIYGEDSLPAADVEL